MDCTVYPDKVYQRITGTLFLAGLVGAWYAVRRYLHGDMIFQAFLGFMALIVLGSLVSSFLMGKGPWYQVDSDGVRARIRFNGTVPWSDVEDVERLPRREHQGSETTFHLKEGWRPVVLTIREPEKHLRGAQSWARALLSAAVAGEPARVRLEFTGLQPLSEEFYNAVEHHLARHAREEKRRPGANRA